MPKEEGWIKIYRTLRNHWIWERSDYLKAWMYLLISANHTDKKTLAKGRTVTCKRGTVNISISQFAREMGWSRMTANKFLKACEADEMITVSASKQRTVITIRNYENYQGDYVPKEKAIPKTPKKPKIPTIAEIQKVIEDRRYHYVDAEKFLAYYADDFPKNWQRVLLTWEKNGEKQQANTPKTYVEPEVRHSHADVLAAIEAYKRGESV